MIPKEIFQQIRKIQIRSAHQVDELLAGSWHSAFKGRGMEFDEVRPYQAGDDIRAIDWSATARSDQPYVKLFREEREMSVRLLVDFSPSIEFGTAGQTKRELVAQLGATLAMSAIRNNDKVGLTLFSSVVEKSLPPRKGNRHALRLIRELLYCQPIASGTDVNTALEHLNRTSRRRSVVFLISDFQATSFETPLKIACRKHDIIPVVVQDPLEEELPNVGIIRLRDAETGQTMVIDTGSRRNRKHYKDLYLANAQQRDGMFRRLKMEPIRLTTGEDIVEPLRRFFRVREKS